MKNDQNARKFCRRFFLHKMYKNMQKRVTFRSQFLSMVEIIIITFIYIKLYALSNKELVLKISKYSWLLLTHQKITCSKSTIETLENGVKYVQNEQFFVHFEHISYLFPVFLLLTLNN